MCYVIFSDIHANYTALARAVETTRAVPAFKKYFFLGDLLGYGPVAQVVKCINWLRYDSQIYQENGHEIPRWIPGNHDEWAVTNFGQMRKEAIVTLLLSARRDRTDTS